MLSLMLRPARDRFTAADDDVLTVVGLDRDRFLRRAAPWKHDRLAIHARADEQRVARIEFVHRGLKRRKRLRLSAGVDIVAGGGDVELRRRQSLASEGQCGGGEELSESVHGLIPF